MSESKMREAKLVEAVTKAILFQDSGSTEDWEANDDLGQAAIDAYRESLAQTADVGLTDEERYRWLREKVTNGVLTVASVGVFDLTAWSGDDLDGAIDAAHETQVERTLHCYQCDAKRTYLFPDSRCETCTRWTPEELRGERKFDED